MSINKLYKDHGLVNPQHWREVGVRFDSIMERSEDARDLQLAALLREMSLHELDDLATLIGAGTKTKKKEDLQTKISQASRDIKDRILLLRDFQNRRKKTIERYYHVNFIKGNPLTSVLVQLVYLFQQSPDHLISIFALNIWENRKSGDLYTLDKNMSLDKALKIASDKGFQDEFKNRMHKASREANEYRVFAHTNMGGKDVYVLLFKQINDLSRSDYQEAIRHRDVSYLLFKLDIDNSTLEIKVENDFETRTIREYVAHTFGGSFQPVTKEIFKDYEADTFRKAVLEGEPATGKPVEDFVVTRVTFGTSPLKNSPEVSLQVKNQDVWTSVIDAHKRGSVNLESLKDLKSLSFRTSGVNRTIRSIVQSNGDVVFVMDDSQLDSKNKSNIETKFRERFGVPMFQPISNEKFSVGVADKYDYAMGQTNPSNLYGAVKDLYDELIDESLMKENKTVLLKCCRSGCTYEEPLGGETPTECPLCDDKVKKVELISTSIDLEHVVKHVKKTVKSLETDGKWLVKNDSVTTLYNTPLKFIVVERVEDGEVFQVLVTDQLFHGRVIDRLKKMLTPTIVVLVGQQEKFLDKYSTDCLESLTFGTLLIQPKEYHSHFYTNIFDRLELRAKGYIAAAAVRAFESIRGTVNKEPSEIEKDYSDKEFEDDVYAVLKDLFPNAEKWGKEKSGQAVPEGVFALSYTIKKGNDPKRYNYAFSYDCKFTRSNKGYDLNKGEQRKAADYVEALNGSDFVASFSTKNQLSAHVLISNRFNPNNFETMRVHFEDQFGDEYEARPVFISTETLVHLHRLYRNNYEYILSVRNVFVREMQQLLKLEDGVVKIEDIDKAFKTVLTTQLKDFDELNTKQLTKEITR